MRFAIILSLPFKRKVLSILVKDSLKKETELEFFSNILSVLVVAFLDGMGSYQLGTSNDFPQQKHLLIVGLKKEFDQISYMCLQCYFILPLLMFFLTRRLIKETFCCFINLAIIGTSSFVPEAIHINLMAVHRYSHGKWSG